MATGDAIAGSACTERGVEASTARKTTAAEMQHNLTDDAAVPNYAQPEET